MSGIFENVRDALRLFPPPRNPGLPGFRLILRKSGKPDLRWGRVREGGKQQARSFELTPLPALRADLPHKGGGNKKSARELRLGVAA